MKNLSLLVWLTQLGLSVVVPLIGFVLLGVWLNNRFSLGSWVNVVCVILGLVCAADGLRTSLKAMLQTAEGDKPVNENKEDK